MLLICFSFPVKKAPLAGTDALGPDESSSRVEPTGIRFTLFDNQYANQGDPGAFLGDFLMWKMSQTG
jgi:hypothetical protein